jgi:hypothetical protein
MAALIAESKPPLLMLHQRPLAIRAAAPLVRSAWRLQSRRIAVQDRSNAMQEEDAGQVPSARPGLALNTYHVMDVLEGLRAMPDCSIDCVVTSSPYNKVSRAEQSRAEQGGTLQGGAVLQVVALLTLISCACACVSVSCMCSTSVAYCAV